MVKDHGLRNAISSDPATYCRNHNGLEKWDLFCKREAIYDRVTREVQVMVLFGDAGSGKSYYARHFDPGNSWPLPDIEPKARLNIDGYNNQRTLIIEDFDGEMPFRSLLKVLDIYNVDFNTKGAYSCANWNWVIITTNKHPTEWYDNARDPWYYDQRVGPLQRRIGTLVTCTGVYPNSMFSWNDSEGNPVLREPDEMPRWIDLLRPENTDADAASEAPVAGRDMTPVPASNAEPLSPIAALTEEISVEELLAEWKTVDEDRDHDFMYGINLELPTTAESDALILGLDGDDEPLRGFNIDPSKDVY